MKYYKEYVDHLSVDETLHEKIMYRLAKSSTRQYIRVNNLRKYFSVAACAVVMLFFAIGVYPHIKLWNTTPNGSNLNIPNPHGKFDAIEQSGAVYHDIDTSQLIGQISSAKVPFSFTFNNKLAELVRINPGNTNNGVRWEEHKYTKDDVESALQISVKKPNLPDGDYTTNQYVLVDEATKNVIAYQTVYYFFNKNTLEFVNRFSVFYFAEQYFESDELHHMKNVSMTNGEIKISDYSEPDNVHAKVPHVRKLVYVENGISVVIEAEATFVQEDGVIDKEKSLERYKQTDKQLVGIMKSLVE